MKSDSKEANNILTGIVVGGIIGGAAFYLWHASRDHHKPMLGKIGKAIADVGEILESSNIDNRDDALDEIESTIPRGESTVNNVLTWVATGISLWKKFNKGN